MSADLTNAIKGLQEFIRKKESDFTFLKRPVTEGCNYTEKWCTAGNFTMEGGDHDFYYLEFRVFRQSNDTRGLDATGYVGYLKTERSATVLLDLLKMNTLPLPISIRIKDELVLLRLMIDAEFEFDSQYYEEMLEGFLRSYKSLKNYTGQKAWLAPLSSVHPDIPTS